MRKLPNDAYQIQDADTAVRNPIAEAATLHAHVDWEKTRVRADRETERPSQGAFRIYYLSIVV